MPKGFDAGDMNLFRYCGDDPVNRTDPDGTIDSWTKEMLWQGGGNKSVSEMVAAIDGYQLRQPAGNATAGYAGGGRAGPGAGRGPGPGSGTLSVRYSRRFLGKNGKYGRPVVEKALGLMRGTKRGGYFYSFKRNVVIDSTDENRTGAGHTPSGTIYLFLNPEDSRFYDPATYRDMMVHFPAERPPETDAGRASVIAHELGHELTGASDENHGGRNVRDNENPVREELEVAPRRAVGGHSFPLE